jgi:GNAT superfamily N-acetyltransferase
VLASWSAPGIEPERDARVVLAAGDVVGYALVQGLHAPEPTIWLELWAREGAGEQAIAADLLRVLRPRLNAGAQRLRPDVTARARVQVEDRRAGIRAAVERAGFSRVRTSLQIVVEDPDWPAPHWPAGVAARTFVPADARALHTLVMNALGDTWGFSPEPFEGWIESTQSGSFDPTLWWIAEHGGEPIGALLCCVDDADPALVWYQVLVVRRDWRGRWLPLALGFHAARELKARGMRRIGAGVDSANPTGAHLLAARTGFETARRFLVYEQRLRGPRPVRRVLRRARRVITGASRS